MTEIKGFTMYETVGMGIQNPRPVVKMPITEEMIEAVRPKAEAEGLTPHQYIEREIDRINAELGAQED